MPSFIAERVKFTIARKKSDAAAATKGRNDIKRPDFALVLTPIRSAVILIGKFYESEA